MSKSISLYLLKMIFNAPGEIKIRCCMDITVIPGSVLLHTHTLQSAEQNCISSVNRYRFYRWLQAATPLKVASSPAKSCPQSPHPRC